MTYILGVKSNGVAAIISDTMVTFDKANAGFQALKTGIFFPGCAYGASGDAAGFRRFVIWCKSRLNGVEEDLSGFWELFLSLVEGYEFHGHGDFQLLLLSRHEGEPNFYILESHSATVSKVGDLVTLGSGKPILDEFVEKFRAEEHELRVQNLIADGWPVWYWPFYYCQELMAFSQGQNYDDLHRRGVGGVFHYLCQTADGEYVQEAAMYALISTFKAQRQITYTIFRVLFAEMALVVESGVTNDLSICLDTAAFPDLGQYGEVEIQKLREKILSDVDRQPHFRFCGFVFSEPRYQAASFACIRGDDAELVLTKEGGVHPMITQAVEQIIAKIDAATGS